MSTKKYEKSTVQRMGYGLAATFRALGTIQTVAGLVIAGSAVFAVPIGLAVSAILTSEADEALSRVYIEAQVRQLHPIPRHRILTIETASGPVQTTAASVISHEGARAAFDGWVTRFGIGWGLGLLGGLLGGGYLVRALVSKGDSLEGEDHQRGAVLLDEEALREKAAAVAKSEGPVDSCAALGGVPIPRAIEPRNFLIAGTVGAGKTTAIRQLLDTAELRGEAVIVYDPSGDLVATYYDYGRGDVILNPYDGRSPVWDLPAEIQSVTDASMIAAQITAPIDGDEDEWTSATQSLVAEGLWALRNAGELTLERALQLVTTDTPDTLRELVAGTSAQRIFSEGAERATASVMFMLKHPAFTLRSLRRVEGEGGVFSWARWAERLDSRQGRQPWVFLGAPERQFSTVRPLIATWIECAAAQVLSLDPGVRRRVWFALDEFASLPRMTAIPRLASMGRKYGSALVLGIQSPSQLARTYGPQEAATLTATAGTQLILRLPGGDPARWASGQLGRQEVTRRSVADQLDGDDPGDKSSVSSARDTREIVLDSEIADLPDLRGYLRIPGVGVGTVQIPTGHLKRPRQAAPFIPADPADLFSGSAMRPSSQPAPASGGGRKRRKGKEEEERGLEDGRGGVDDGYEI